MLQNLTKSDTLVYKMYQQQQVLIYFSNSQIS